MRTLKPEDKKLIGICVVIALIAIAVAVAIPGIGILARTTRIVQVSKDLSEKNAQLEEIQRKERSLPQLQEEITEAETKIEEVARRLPNDKRAPELFQELNDLAETAQQEYLSMEARPVVEKKTYIEIPLEIELKADYHNLGRYINMIERSERFAKVDQLNVEYDFDDPGTQKVGLIVSTFIFKEKKAPSRSTSSSGS